MEISEEMLSAIIPTVVHWVFAGIYGLLGTYLTQYRLHPKGDEEKNNTVSKRAVIKGVLIQHVIQIAVHYMAAKVRGNEGLAAKEQQPSLTVVAVQWIIAMIVMDTWQYFVHRFIHVNRFLYRHIHAAHHAQIVPYVYGALYGHPTESLLMDIIGGALAFLISGMTTRTSIFFFSFATIKSLDLHSGLYIPWNPLQALFFNNCAFHDTHHQLKGHRHNFSQPFFISWDKILGTYMPYSVEERTGGGFEIKFRKDA
ncbi:sphinganine C4-monooxygenase 2-like [Dioscorea cayenensis subsp. rotundata]|uniref:aldehyde oxygenase (deformylating) n=1 Tax=Dioscorea cayennensis subsp. rotundata TaxID=55577 RepID=A0AB40AJK8_DIOCR|nr:sphinganine C4-monooxygenase 2-like [Dioscorea cayenensis subsp. rotundata]